MLEEAPDSMAIANRQVTTGTWPQRLPEANVDFLRAWAHARLTSVFESAGEIPFDDSSRIILFSDCHRGDNSRADGFARNEALFLRALNFYQRNGFSYIEVGDGDDIWKNERFDDILCAHPQTFDKLHQFNRRDRLHLIFGNHDAPGRPGATMKKNGLVAAEGLILRHAKSGQRIFVVHGHQADYKSDRLRVLSRITVRHGWRRLQLMGIETVLQRTNAVWQGISRRTKSGRGNGIQPFWISEIAQAKKLCEKRIMSWAEAHQQTIICAHTHRPMVAACGGPPYLNTGCCDVPGRLTGLEIQSGEIALVQWTSRGRRGNGRATQVKRELLAPPRKLCRLA
jgi:UDP-2,3-diacylglucosamine pyrophosphatase LpxH